MLLHRKDRWAVWRADARCSGSLPARSRTRNHGSYRRADGTITGPRHTGELSYAGRNRIMSRRAVTLVVVFLGVLLAGNIIVLSVWLPSWKGRAGNLQSANRTIVSSPATSSQPTNTPLAPAVTVAPSSDTVLERLFASPSGNLMIK